MPAGLEDHFGVSMTKREIATLSFKVLSIYAIIQAINQSYNVLYYLIYKNQLDDTSRINLVLNSVPIILLTLCCIILWCAAPFLATSIFKATTSENSSQASGVQASLVSIQVIAFSVVGLFILATSLPNLVDIIVVILLTSKSIQGGTVPIIHDIIVLSLKVVLGFWLLFGSHGIVNFIRSVQRD